MMKILQNVNTFPKGIKWNTLYQSFVFPSIQLVENN